jgi:hypothetical protein
MMLKREGVYENVVDSLASQGKDPALEFLNLYASPVLGQAVADALPSFASDQKEVREIFRANFPRVTDISDDETMTVMRELLELQSDTPGEIPCTVVVLDELQQYISENNEKLEHVQNITELCASSFDSKVMLVATGQSALQGGGIIEKMKDRFYLRVELSDKDVEQVTRTLVLRKKPQMQASLGSALDAVSGEINKHVVSTRFGARPTDAPDLIPDYPVLPVRRRFWEQTLRAIDRGGGSGQLRTQLRVTHDANKHVADDDLGHVVGADFIFSNQAGGMLSAKVLPQDTYQRIKNFEDGSPEGELKARVLGLVFLISQLPSDEGADTGLRSRPEMLAELLVTDLKEGSAQLQPQVEQALNALEQEGLLVNVDGDYRLQTPQGAELRRRFHDRMGQLRNDTARMTQERREELRAAVEKSIGGIRVNQGQSKTPRKIVLSFNDTFPDVSGRDIPVWVRDEWSVSPTEFRAASQQAGKTDPTVFVFLPRLHNDRLRDLIASYHSATDVLQSVPAPDSPEAYQAQAGLEAQQRSSRAQLDQVINEILANAKVWQGGGNEISEGALAASVLKAVDASLVRRFPKFKEGDHAKWETVVERAKGGLQNPLEAVDFKGEVVDHPVTRAILAFLGAGKKGSEIRSHFNAGEYGWPDEAINGALLVLVVSEVALARDKAGKQVSAKDIRKPDIGVTVFTPQTVILSAKEKVTVRKLLTDCGINVSPGQELEGSSRLLQQLTDLAQRAGGNPPLPAMPDTALIQQIASLEGNALVKRVHDEATALKAKHKEWAGLAGSAGVREAEWQTLQRLLNHASGLPVVEEKASEIAAVEEGRQLLANPNPLNPLVETVGAELRAQLNEAHVELKKAVEEAISDLKKSPNWATVGDDDAREVLARHGLRDPQLGKVGSPAELLAVLDATPLSDWKNRIDAIPTRVAAVQVELAQLAQPEVTVKPVKLPSRVLKTAEEVDEFVTEVRDVLHAALDDNTHLSV